MKNSKIDARLKSLWFKFDFKTWKETRDRLRPRRPVSVLGIGMVEEQEKIDALIWNDHYKNFNLRVCITICSKCNSHITFVNENGSKCVECGTQYGLHGFEIDLDTDIEDSSFRKIGVKYGDKKHRLLWWNKYNGLPYMHIDN